MSIFSKKESTDEQEPPTLESPAADMSTIDTYSVDDQVHETARISAAILSEVEGVILGKRPVLEMVMVGVLSGGHILFEDNPGLAKTLMANTFAQALGCSFKRIQFTPDLLPADITGTYIFDRKDQEFKFRPGPIFCNLLLADEINRAPPKTQAALLEAMQEKQVTIEGVTHKLPHPFLVMATQNPLESEGTYPLPDAQLDRFMMKLAVGYPGRAVEKAILMKRKLRGMDEHDVEPLADEGRVQAMQRALEQVHIDPSLLEYIVELVNLTREDPRVQVGSSPRGALTLFKLSRAVAVLNGRDYVIPDDIKRVAIYGLRHRVMLKPEPRIKGVKPEEIISKILTDVEVPTIQGFT